MLQTQESAIYAQVIMLETHQQESLVKSEWEQLIDIIFGFNKYF